MTVTETITKDICHVTHMTKKETMNLRSLSFDPYDQKGNFEHKVSSM
jgi:hypothetical protein